MVPFRHGYNVTEENTTIYETTDPDQTFNLAEVMASVAKPGEVYALQGDLGVGKTVFAKGFGCGLGIKEDLTSPTYTIVQEYDSGRIPLYHFDMYRLGDSSELIEIGWDDYLNREGIILAEWPENVIDEMPEHYKLIKIDKDLEQGEDYRVIRVINK